jgi:integrase
VLTRQEVRQVLDLISGTPQLIARVLYGSGLRLMECLRLRVKDLDFTYHQIIRPRWHSDNPGRVACAPLLFMS